MGKRGGVIDHEEGLAKLSLPELDAEIDRRRTRLKIAPTSQLRQSFRDKGGFANIPPRADRRSKP